MKIEKVDGTMADVAVGDIKAKVSVMLLEKPKKGDYVLVHAGIAIEKINKARADEILTLMTELGQKIDDRKQRTENRGQI